MWNSNIEYCTETLKASQVIDYTVESWWETLGPNSVDVVYDCIGETDCADHALEVLRSGGSFVSIMFQQPGTPREDVKCGVFVNSDTNLDNLEQLDALKVMVEAGQLRMPRIDHTFTLCQIDDALAQSASKRTVGKASIECSGEAPTASTKAATVAEEGVPPEPEPLGSDELRRGSTLVGTTTAGNMGDEEDMIED